MLWRLGLRLLERLGLKPDAHAGEPKKRYLAGLIAAVPESVRQACGARWGQDHYILRREPLDARKLVEDSFAVYAAEPEFDLVCQRNLRRFGRSTLNPDT